ncbi:MAG: minichromosome maintenance protein MCM [Candidatus Micrarchaeaceae archaeon]
MDEIASSELEEKFSEFLNNYYSEQIKDMYIGYPKTRSLNLDIRDLEHFDTDIALQLIHKPDELLPIANAALSKMNPDQDAKEPVHARFYGVTTQAPMIQDVGSEFIGQFLSLDSLVVKRSEITPKVNIGYFKCLFCASVIEIKMERDTVVEVCPQCKRKSLKQDPERSRFSNLQRLAVQDPLERLKGSTPTWQLEVWMEDDLVNKVIPGDRIDITGILRIKPRKNPRGKEDKILFTMFFEAVSIKPRQKEFAELDITEDDKVIINDLSKDPEVFDKIAKSLAPSIYGHNEIKKALVLQLFGGTPEKKLVDGALIRSDIHILLIGDPGSAKTRFLQAVTEIVPKGIYVSGKSTSGAGLTAAAERDEFSEGGWTLKAGALVLGSGGEVSIDEFDKIGNEDKSALLEALESQSISVAKAGIVAKFSAKTSVLAAANPKYGRFDRNLYPAEQFDISPALLSRFDLIFPITDVLDEERDREIANHIMVQHSAAGAQIAQEKEYEQVEKQPINTELLRKYVAYARKNIKPRLNSEASQRIQDYYVELRKIGMKQGAVPITPRQIEGLVRLSEASAKSRLSDKIEKKDADLAIFLFDYMLSSLAVDRGGRKDIDTLLTGMPREKVDRMNNLLNIIKRLESEEESAKIARILEEAEKLGIDRNTTSKYLLELERSGDVFSPRQGIIKMVKRSDD